MFQVFQLIAFVIRGPVTRSERFIINLDRAAIEAERVRGVLLCVQGFFRSPHFTQRKLFSESVLTMLSESVAIADSITSISVYASLSLVGTAGAGQIVSDLCACWDRAVLRRRTAKDTTERWYHGGTSGSQTASRPGLRIPDVVEEGLVEYVPVASPALGPPGPSKIPSSPSKRKKKISRSTVKLPQNIEISSPPAAFRKRSLEQNPNFACALTEKTSHGKSHRNGRD